MVSLNSRKINIFGDNIVECERTLELLSRALACEYPNTIGPTGPPTTPRFKLISDDGQRELRITQYPGFGRWPGDPSRSIHSRGGTIRENPDAIVSENIGEQEKPLLAIEYSAALAAGNQAWQRNGRAYSLGIARLPYLYVAELGGYELDKNRNRKAPRYPNAAVPFSFLSHSLYTGSPVLPVFVKSPAIDSAAQLKFADVLAKEELLEYVKATVLGTDPTRAIAILNQRALDFVMRLAEQTKRNDTMQPDQWKRAYEAIVSANSSSLVDFLLGEPLLPWKKRTSIELTDKARQMMDLGAELCQGITSTSLPICLLPTEERSNFASRVADLHPGMDEALVAWIEGRLENLVRPLALCWVLGFKPRGDDARPDRGLPPFLRMLVGSDCDILTIIYGPAPPAHLELLNSDPGDLARKNGLWEAILTASDAVIVESKTAGSDLGILVTE